MQFLGILALGLAPGIFWLWLIYRWDKYQPEPRGLVIRTFLLGMLVVIPVLFLEVALVLPLYFPDLTSISIDSLGNLSAGEQAYFAFIVAGFSEELGKFLVVRTTIFNSPYFDEPADGIVYSAAAALGFASLENVVYIVQGWQIILIRGPISTTAHVMFSMLWGYPLALQKLGRRNGRLLTWGGLAAAMAAHGLFDFLALTPNGVSLLVMPFFVGMAVLFFFMMRHSRRISPKRNRVGELQMMCEQCGTEIPAYAKYCSGCGEKIQKEVKDQQFKCGKCGALVNSNDSYCTTCGSRIVRKPLNRT